MLEAIEKRRKIRLKMSESDYLDRELANEDESTERYEFLNGHIRNMGYATDAHETLVTNIVSLLHFLLRKTQKRIYTSNRLLYVEAFNRYFYPDAQIVDGEPINRIYKQNMQALTNPVLLVEVISDSSDEYDHVEKWNCYQTIPSLQQYVMISQKEIKVESYRRVADEWLYVSVSNEKATVKILDCDISLVDLYEKVVF